MTGLEILRCSWCDEPMARGKRGPAPTYCCPAHRMAAYRARREVAAFAAELEPAEGSVAPTPSRPSTCSSDEEIARAVLEAKVLAGTFYRLGREARPQLRGVAPPSPTRSRPPSAPRSGRRDRVSDLEIRMVPTTSLVLDAGNARKHGARNLDAIKESLSRFGQRRALVVMSDMTVIAGNGTLTAARALGWESIAITVVPDDWTAEQAKAYALADNRTAELATWDEVVLEASLGELEAQGWDMTALGFDSVYGLPDTDLDKIPEAPEPETRPGDLWALGEHRLICGSSTDDHIVACLFQDRLADCVMTDPPYGVDYVGWTGKTIANDNLKDEALGTLLLDSLGLAWAFTADGCPVYLFHSDANRPLALKPYGKTSHARRTVSGGPSLADALRRHRREQAERRLTLGAAWADNDLVLCGSGGEIVRPSSVSRAFSKIVRVLEKSAALPVRKTSFHTTRHTHATPLLRAGVPVHVVSKRLGHATIQITLDYYGHVIPSDDASAATTFDRIMAASV